MVKVTCKNCSKIENVAPWRAKVFVFCSRKCLSISMMGHKTWNTGLTKLTDKRLMGVAKKSKKRLLDDYASGKIDRYAITKNANAALRKRSMDRFNAGNISRYINKRGYWVIHVPLVGKTLEHRYLMEKYLGRKLKSSEVIHHINENKLDNRIVNLRLFSSNSEHIKFHNKTNES